MTFEDMMKSKKFNCNLCGLVFSIPHEVILHVYNYHKKNLTPDLIKDMAKYLKEYKVKDRRSK